MADNQDFDIYKSLWMNINNVCAPPPPPGAPAKACFLMEMPGFTVDPNAFNPKSFNPSTMVSPECATATLCDRVPAFASYFYDTGERISSNYKLFMETFTIKSTREECTALKERYDEAIKMLYDDEQGYVMQKKLHSFWAWKSCMVSGKTPREQEKSSGLNVKMTKKNGHATTNAVPLLTSKHQGSIHRVRQLKTTNRKI